VRATLIALAACSLCLWGELLPIRTYTTSEGLAANQVGRIVIDSRGFVWLCTPEGLSRFDGYRVTNFGMAEGLPDREVQAFLETRSGEYLVGSPRGLSQFRPGAGKSQFVTYTVGSSQRDNNITALFQSSDGRIWIGAWGALFEMLPGPKFRLQPLPPPLPPATGIDINQIAEDSCGKLWLGSVTGVYVVARDGAVQRIGEEEGLPGKFVNTVFADKDRNLWVGVRGGFARMRDGCGAGTPGVEQSFPVGRNVMSFTSGSDGTLWAATVMGLVRMPPGGNGSYQLLTRAQGLSDRSIFSLASDKSGNIWAGTEGAGAMVIEPDGFSTFHEQDGLSSDRVWSVLGDSSGHVMAVAMTQDMGKFSLNIFDGAGFRPMAAPQVFAAYHQQKVWGSHRILLQSRTGEWWAATAGGLCRYPAVKVETLADRAPEQCYDREATVFQIFEDSKGGIWASAQNPGDQLMRWDPEKKQLFAFHELPGANTLVKSFAEDHQGRIWMGIWGAGGLYRYDGGHFDLVIPQNETVESTIFSLFVDRQGRLWVGAKYGLGLVENPGAERFQMRLYDQSSGLSNNSVHAVIDDQQGFIYAATDAGIDRLDPQTGHIRHFSAADGVARGEMESAFRDSRGNLWFAAAQGLSRLTPSASRPPGKPAVLITGLRAGGAPFAVSQKGETSIAGIELDPGRNQLQVEFVAFGGEPEANLRYAYKLEGGGSNWSTPQSQHVVNFGALAAGKYRFLVKAMNSDGMESVSPAEVAFTVLPPFWRRWWFEGLAFAALASAIYALHRYRVSQMVGLERMRTAIATDLHDDIGSSLSQIAILSEVARAGVTAENHRAQESLQRVAVLARELVDSMSDIVWSIRVEPGGWDSLVRRMREFALDLLGSQGIAFEMQSPRAGRFDLSLEARRHLFLMFKECIHNVSRHSGCTEVRVEMKVVEHEIELTVVDNGRGWSPEDVLPGSAGGNGIPGMRRRAETMGGSIQFASRPGEGSEVFIRLPMRRGAFDRERG
jgi:ligand-binding sensor domain-containing protein/signal transduction histidine kinase